MSFREVTRVMSPGWCRHSLSEWSQLVCRTEVVLQIKHPRNSKSATFCMSRGMLRAWFVSFYLLSKVQYIPRNIHTVFALLCFVVVIHWLIFPYPSGLLHWHCGNLTIAPVPAKQPWWIWINTSCEFIMNDCITTTKKSTTKPCAYFLGYIVHALTSDRRHYICNEAK